MQAAVKFHPVGEIAQRDVAGEVNLVAGLR